MKKSLIWTVLVCGVGLVCFLILRGDAAPSSVSSTPSISAELPPERLRPHKALYDITLVSTKSGAQVVNVSGEMYYELNMTCDAWITDHRFNLRYEYSDTPAVNVKSTFSTFESFDGEDFNFTSTRTRSGNVYEELQGYATMGESGGRAVYKMPEGLTFDLPNSTKFPMRHTLELLENAKQGENLFNAVVFDGSDDEGPVSINAFIGKTVNVMANEEITEKMDATLLNNKAHRARLAFFPLLKDQASSDYEMEMIFHENGVVSDMLVEYQLFSVTQDLLALEKLPMPDCQAK